MLTDVRNLKHTVNLSISAAQNHIQACMRAVEQKDKEALKVHSKALKIEVEQLAAHLEPALQQSKNS